MFRDWGALGCGVLGFRAAGFGGFQGFWVVSFRVWGSLGLKVFSGFMTVEIYGAGFTGLRAPAGHGWLCKDKK